MKILHFSDPHGQTETMSRLNEVAKKATDCMVVCCTGDCISFYDSEVPPGWNKWPQQLKLLVPGNHPDVPEHFATLTTWSWHTPQYHIFGGIVFVSFKATHNCHDVPRQLEDLFRHSRPACSAVVILAHQWPEERYRKEVGDKIRHFFPTQPVLYLHGHKHPARGSFWDRAALLGSLSCCRSNVASCASSPKGVAHVIEWGWGRFTYKTV